MTGVMKKGFLSFNVTILRKRRQSLWIWNVKIAARKRRSYFVGCIWSTFCVHIHCFNRVPIWKTSCICLKGTHCEFSAENWHLVSKFIYLNQLRMLWMILLCHKHVSTCSVVISLRLLPFADCANTVRLPVPLFFTIQSYIPS